MAIAKPGQIMGAEVTRLNRSKGTTTLELDTGETAVLSLRNLAGDSVDKQLERFESFVEGTEIQVLVTAERQDGNFKSFFFVSERLDDRIEGEPEDADKPSNSGRSAVSQAVLELFTPGRQVRGVVLGNSADGIIVQLDGVRATLPYSELGGTKRESLRPKVNVRASVLRSDAGGVVLTRKAS